VGDRYRAWTRAYCRVHGSEIQAATLQDVFGGDQAAYDAKKPVNLLAGAAPKAGMAVTYWESPNGGHVLPALIDGLDKAFQVVCTPSWALLRPQRREPSREPSRDHKIPSAAHVCVEQARP